MTTPPYTIHHGDCLDVMRGIPDASVDAVVCDPPYGLEFMGKDWDRLDGEAWRTGGAFTKPGIGARDTAWPSYGSGDTANATCATCGGRMRGAKRCACASPEWRVKGKPIGESKADTRQSQGVKMGEWHRLWAVEALRVAKPGAHLLAFGGTRTFHRLTCAIEDAGWEIRDCLSWLYGSGFPKSHNGPWGGTALKPAWEPIILARKPLIGTVKANHAAHGTGALNIDATRIGTDEVPSGGGQLGANGVYSTMERDESTRCVSIGRWPANVVLSHHEDCDLNGSCGPGCPVMALDEQSGERRSAGDYPSDGGCRTDGWGSIGTKQGDLYADAGGASRFFFVSHDGSTIKPCAKCLARSVASPSCPSSGPAVSAQSDALTASDRIVPPETVGLASTGNSGPYTPLRSRALSAGSPGNIGTIPTTPNFCESCGSALHATAAPISRDGAARVEDASDPVSGTRFWYSAKASRGEREAGLREAGLREAVAQSGMGGAMPTDDDGNDRDRFKVTARNTHPTVKPVDLMRWLVRLVTPLGGTVLDPFLGSGTTLVAALQEGCKAIGIEREAQYVEIARARIANAAKAPMFDWSSK